MTQQFDIRSAFREGIKGGQRVFAHDRSKTVGASEVFGCLRRSYFAKFLAHLADPRKISMGAAERGNIIENHFVVPMLHRIFGEQKVKYAGDDQVTLVKDYNSATPDALIIEQPRDILAKYDVPDIGGDHFGIEVKSFDPRANIQEEKYVHRGQAITQMGLFRETTEYSPNFVMILYVNAADFDDIRPFIVSHDQHIYTAAKARAKAVMTAKDPYDLKAEGAAVDACRYCPFTAACRDADLSRFPDAKGVLTDNEEKTLLSMALEYNKVSKSVKEGESTKKAMAEDIKRFLNACGTKGAVVPGFRVAYSKMDGRETLDQDLMEKDGIDLEQYKSRGGGYTRLQITPVDAM